MLPRSPRLLRLVLAAPPLLLLILLGLVLLILLGAALWTLSTSASSSSQPSCPQLRAAHDSLLSVLFELRVHPAVRPHRHGHTAHVSTARPPPPPSSSSSSSSSSTLHALLLLLRRRSSHFLRLHHSYSHHTMAHCGRQLLSDADRAMLEFSVSSRYHTDGILLYLTAIGGAVRRAFVEIDGAPGAAAVGAAVLFAHAYNWSVHAVHEAWTGYEFARQLYLRESKGGARTGSTGATAVVVIDAGRLLGRTMQVSHAHGFGGTVDIAALFAANGDDLLLFDTFRSSSGSSRSRTNDSNHAFQVAWLTPRIVLVFYLDFWPPGVDRWRTAAPHERAKPDGVDRLRRRLYAGGSIAAVVRVAARAGYRLVWCLGSAPIAVFAHAGADLPVPAISEESCIDARRRHSPTWTLDAEAMWDEAQQYHWNSS